MKRKELHAGKRATSCDGQTERETKTCLLRTTLLRSLTLVLTFTEVLFLFGRVTLEVERLQSLRDLNL